MTMIVKKKKPHLALTHNELQNGAANGRNVSLLMKADAEIDEDTAALIEKVTGVKVEVTKASVNTVRELIREKLDKFKTDRWDWVYVEDWDEDYVVFSHEGGLYYTTLEVDGLAVTLGDTATSVSRVVNFAEVDGSPVLDNQMKDVDGGVAGLIVKSFDNISKNEKLMDVLKSKKKEEKMEVEIEKAVGEATKILKSELDAASVALKEAQDTIEALQKSAKDQVTEIRKTAIASVVADEGQAEALLKSTETLDDDSFNTILKSLKVQVDITKGSDLFARQSETTDIEKSDKVLSHEDKIRNKYKKD